MAEFESRFGDSIRPIGPTEPLTEYSHRLRTEAARSHAQNERRYQSIKGHLEIISEERPQLFLPSRLHKPLEVLAKSYGQTIVEKIETPLAYDTKWNKAGDKTPADAAVELFQYVHESKIAAEGIALAIEDRNVRNTTKDTLIEVFGNERYRLPEVSRAVVRLAETITNTATAQRAYTGDRESILVEPRSKTLLLSSIDSHLAFLTRSHRNNYS